MSDQDLEYVPTYPSHPDYDIYDYLHIIIIIIYYYLHLLANFKHPTTSYINVAQTSTLSRLLILRVVLLYGNIQVCITPYILQRSLSI